MTDTTTRNNTPRLARIGLLALLIVPLLAALALSGAPAAPAQAAACGAGPLTPVITSVEPDVIKNDRANTLTVRGSGFEAGAVVLLEGYGALQTTCLTAEILSAAAPAGIPGKPEGRLYDVTVINPSGSSTTLAGGLTVKKVTPDPTAAPTATPAPTSTPLPTVFARPILSVQSYGASSLTLYAGQDIDFEMTVVNGGQAAARNVVITFVTGDLLPRTTGSVRALGDLAPGQAVRFFQAFTVSSNIRTYEVVLRAQASYTDDYGTPYSDAFEMSFASQPSSATATPQPTPTATPTLSVRPQVIVERYSTDPATITPGAAFTLSVNLVNVSGETARQVVASLNQRQGATSLLVPLASGNVRYVSEMAPGASTTVTYSLAVDGDATAGLEVLDLALSYVDNFNMQHNETATISLRIDTAPFLQIGFFEPLPEPIYVGDIFDLPIEVVNYGRQMLNVSNIEATSDKVRVTNGIIYLGPLDPGTSGTLLAQGEALQAGTATVTVRVHYLDGFQQPQVFEQTLSLEVEGVPLDESGQEITPTGGEEEGELTFLQRVWRAILGLLGLGTRPAEDVTATATAPLMPGRRGG
jgi:hypothetical protein